MKVDIRPWEPGGRGYTCMPIAANLPDAAGVQERHPDWKLVQCPVCGADCWESEVVRQMGKEEVRGVCTLCALKKGAKATGKPLG